jgi:pyridoxamine 5'-phosphate oxidase
MLPPRLQTLPEIEAALWRELARAPRDKHHEWRTPVLATADGDRADARTVVLREVDPEERTLRVFSDSRSAKVAQLLAQPQGMLVMWSARLSWQLRLRVALRVETDGLALASRWARLKLSPGAQDYLSPLAPGSALPGGPELPAPLQHDRGHFALISAQVQAIDWLELHAEGHRRAGFDAAGARWLAP